MNGYFGHLFCVRLYGSGYNTFWTNLQQSAIKVKPYGFFRSRMVFADARSGNCYSCTRLSVAQFLGRHREQYARIARATGFSPKQVDLHVVAVANSIEAELRIAGNAVRLEGQIAGHRERDPISINHSIRNRTVTGPR